MKYLWIKLLVNLSVPVFLILGSVQMLATDRYLYFEYAKASFPADPFGFNPEERLAYAAANIRYVREALPIQSLGEQRLGDQGLYNGRELKHMQDVQRVYQIVRRVWLTSAAVLLALSVFLLREPVHHSTFARAIRSGGLLTAVSVAFTGLLAVAAWRIWFVVFHQIFFAPGSWTFNTSDTLIRLFPEKFWFDAALTASSVSLVGGLLFFAMGSIAGKKLVSSVVSTSHQPG